MEKSKILKDARQIALAAVSATLFCLFAASLFAAILRGGSCPQSVVSGVGWALKGLAAFCFSLLFIHRGGALGKGMIAGALFSALSLLLFALIGGGFEIDALFAAELLFTAVLGGLGALLGVKLRKED